MPTSRFTRGCLNGSDTMDLAMQTELFEVAFEELSANDDLINQVLEVTMTDPDEIGSAGP
ncbi:hypothetical protein ACVITL_006502 [Rhizobium pisi]